MRCTHPLLRNCQDNAKLACHCTACCLMEWGIYTQNKMRGQGNLELAQETIYIERKRMRNGLCFENLILACTMDLMDDLGLVR